MIDGDVFRIIVPLDDEYSYDVGDRKVQLKGNDCTLSSTFDCTNTQSSILEILIDNPSATQVEIAEFIGKSIRTIKNDMAVLKEKGILKRQGGKKHGVWVVSERKT